MATRQVIVPIRVLLDATGISRKTGIKWITTGVVKGKNISGRWFVDATDLERVVG